MIKGYRHREDAAREKLFQHAVSDDVRRRRAKLLQDRELKVELEAAEETVARARAALEAAKAHRPEQSVLDAALAQLAELQAATGHAAAKPETVS